jgi:hypothetical protein
MVDTDSVGCFACPDGENTIEEGLFLAIVHCVLLTGN